MIKRKTTSEKIITAVRSFHDHEPAPGTAPRSQKVCGKKIPSSCFPDWDWDSPFWILVLLDSEPISGDF